MCLFEDDKLKYGSLSSVLLSAMERPERMARISTENGQPELYQNGIWSPICGHWFWDNQHGATLFCQELKGKLYTGRITSNRYTQTLASKGVNVGRCDKNDKSIMECTGPKIGESSKF